MVSQIEGEIDGGGLGDPQLNIDDNRRTLGQLKDGWRQLDALQDNPAAQRDLSRDLGLVVDFAKRGRRQTVTYPDSTCIGGTAPCGRSCELPFTTYITTLEPHSNDAMAICVPSTVLCPVHVSVPGLRNSIHRGDAFSINLRFNKSDTTSPPPPAPPPLFQGTTANIQIFLVDLLSKDGRSLGMSIMAQKKHSVRTRHGASQVRCD